ncbi:MAG: DUF4376 domain-containing protein [Candidatus Dactylopiibacterium sp.]|nr:DUF4376 domain-containing protein [Candidatus Dactylopiibacterium sp.]
MPFIREFITPTGVPTHYHRATHIGVRAAGVFVVVNSWATQAMHDQEGAPVAWQDTYGPAPLSALAGEDPLASAETWLASAAGPFAGAELHTPSRNLDLAQAQARAWERVKAGRNAAEVGGFDVPGIGRFDSDAISQQRIVGAIVAAHMPRPVEQGAWVIVWTLADNTAIELDAEQMIDVGNRLAAHVDATHQRGRFLRERIASVEVVEQANLIVWTPADAPVPEAPPAPGAAEDGVGA